MFLFVFWTNFLPVKTTAFISLIISSLVALYVLISLRLHNLSWRRVLVFFINTTSLVLLFAFLAHIYFTGFANFGD